MSYWAETKKLVNGTIGSSDFEPIDKLISIGRQVDLPYQWGFSVNLDAVIYKLENIPNSQSDINIISSVDGCVGIEHRIISSGTFRIYINNDIVWEGTSSNQDHVRVKVKRGDLIRFVFSSPHTEASIRIYGFYVSRYGLREVE